MGGIDTINKFCVSATGDDRVLILNALALHLPISKQDALLLAAWLVALADVGQDPRFEEILQAVLNT